MENNHAKETFKGYGMVAASLLAIAVTFFAVHSILTSANDDFDNDEINADPGSEQASVPSDDFSAGQVLDDITGNIVAFAEWIVK